MNYELRIKNYFVPLHIEKILLTTSWEKELRN